MNDRSHLLTEQRLPESMRLDAMSVAEAGAMMNAQDALAVAAVGREQAAIARMIELDYEDPAAVRGFIEASGWLRAARADEAAGQRPALPESKRR